MSKPSVYVTIPNGDEWLHKGVAHFLLQTLEKMRTTQCHSLCVDMPTAKPIAHNRNQCAEGFLASGFDFWLSIDTDNPPIGNPLNRLKDNLDFVGFPTPIWKPDVIEKLPYYFNAMDAVDAGWIPHLDTNGLQSVDAVGTGCFLVARRVISSLSRAKHLTGKSCELFDAKWEGKETEGNDFRFCRKVKAAGFEVYADFDCPCRHFVQLDLYEVIQRFMRSKGIADSNPYQLSDLIDAYNAANPSEVRSDKVVSEYHSRTKHGYAPDPATQPQTPTQSTGNPALEAGPQTLRMMPSTIKAMKDVVEMGDNLDAEKCTCHERDSSYVCEYCYAQGLRGHMQRKP